MDSDDVYVRSSVQTIVQRVILRMNVVAYPALVQQTEEMTCVSFQEALEHTRDPVAAEREAELSAAGVLQLFGIQ